MNIQVNNKKNKCNLPLIEKEDDIILDILGIIITTIANNLLKEIGILGVKEFIMDLGKKLKQKIVFKA